MSSFDDILYPEVPDTIGSYHPIIQAKIFLINMLEDFGFQHVSGPEIENEEFNFDMLNIKKSHPARQMHDTFYLNKKDSLLRTHTSPVQIRTMLNEDPPFAFSSAGKVFRKDDDATHLPMFHQVEGMYVDNNVTFANLKDLIHKIIYHIFDENVEIRFRPSFFPFTEPSAEVDILSENGKWLEILGCGLINPVVLDNCGIDSSKYNGLAFGLGIERIAMLKYGVGDIREFYKSNLDFLNQFK